MAKIVNGKQLADEAAELLKKKIADLEADLKLVVVLVGDNPVSEKYIKKKQQMGERIGVIVECNQFPSDIEESKLADAVAALDEDDSVDGIIVQLPLPQHIDARTILVNIDSMKDVDALSPNPFVHSPVARSIEHILESEGVDVNNLNIAIVGAEGRLVGKPVVKWAELKGANIMKIGRDTLYKDRFTKLREADIIVSGTGVPSLIQP